MNRFLHLLLFVLLIGCSEDLKKTEEAPTEVVESVETIISEGDENYLNKNSDYIFDQEKLATFELNLPEASLRKINSNPAAEEYVEGSLTFEGETISPVGIRYKGSIGAFVDCLSGTDWANPSGFKTCTKISMKVKINWEGRDEKFFGLKKLQFHSQNQDNSQMRERLGYWLFREMGVPAPRSVHARLLINGEFAGLFALTEQIDGRFTRYNFEDGKGNLYKEVWPLNSSGGLHNDNTYLQALKTNEDENPSLELMKSFAKEISNATDEDLKSVVEQYMDVDKIISYAVVDRTIRNDDGAFHWYCGGNSCEPHNYYWYEETDANKLHLIPWDLDNAFENIIADINPVVPIADAWGMISNNCQPYRHGLLGAMQRSAACDRLTYAWTLFEEEYQAKLNSFKEGPLSEAALTQKLDAWTEQIEAATLEAGDAFNDAVTINEWRLAVGTLKSNLNYARQ